MMDELLAALQQLEQTQGNLRRDHQRRRGAWIFCRR